MKEEDIVCRKGRVLWRQSLPEKRAASQDTGPSQLAGDYMEFSDKYRRGAHIIMALSYAGGVLSGVRLPLPPFHSGTVGKAGLESYTRTGSRCWVPNRAGSQAREAI